MSVIPGLLMVPNTTENSEGPKLGPKPLPAQNGRRFRRIMKPQWKFWTLVTGVLSVIKKIMVIM
jgi:hypothetical protein